MTATRTAPASGQRAGDCDCAEERVLYEIRLLTTPADRAAARALVGDRARDLADRSITLPGHHLTAYHKPVPGAEIVGLFEEISDREDMLIGCLHLHRRPPGTYGRGQGLGISLVYTAPGRGASIGWLLTLWAGDLAARSGAASVHAQAPARRAGGTEGRLLDHLRSLGWLSTRKRTTDSGEYITDLRFHAQQRDGLTGMVRCTIPLHPDTTDEGTR
ncbi:hypothetical protein ACODT5_01470 [Streptomyces sp. 5.8]|uniref:hypothetical protein n=1 Tax=Streptomyces sp. 5.8 TaxID=3406571 RepID=UPI003BB74061